MVQFCSKIASTLEVLTLKLCPRRLNHGDFRSHLLLTLRHAPNLRCVSIGRASNPTVFSSLACLTQIKQLMLGDLDIQSDGHSPSVQHLSCLRSLEELQLQRLSADDDWAEPSEEVASSMCRALSKLLKLRSVKMEFCYIQDVPSDYDVSSGFMASVSLLTKISCRTDTLQGDSASHHGYLLRHTRTITTFSQCNRMSGLNLATS